MRYEVRLEGDEWVVLRNDVEEARYIDVDRVLAHARRGLVDEGYDEWAFDLGYRCVSSPSS